MNKNLIIALLAILSVGSTGYIIYDKVSGNHNNDLVENKENSNEVSNYKLEDFTKIVEDELSFFVSQENFDDLTNDEKNIYDLSSFVKKWNK